MPRYASCHEFGGFDMLAMLVSTRYVVLIP